MKNGDTLVRIDDRLSRINNRGSFTINRIENKKEKKLKLDLDNNFGTGICFDSVRFEIKELKPKLLIVATSYAIQRFWEEDKLSTEKMFGKQYCLLDQGEIPLLYRDGNVSCKAVVYPNPSPGNRSKKDFYGNPQFQKLKGLVDREIRKLINL